ncbi:MAG: hypothetical protein IPH43_09565 [Xanthomonadales bacterium]|nr:hypothetical protein [Xanthomonadales bacterium]
MPIRFERRVERALRRRQERGVVISKPVCSEYRPTVRKLPRLGRIGFHAAVPVAEVAIAQGDRVFLIGSQHGGFDDLPDSAKPGMLVLRTGQRAQVEGGQVSCMRGLHGKRLANGQRQFGTDQAIVEEAMFEALANTVDGLGIAAKQPRHDQHRTAKQARVRFQGAQRQLALVCTQGNHMRIAGLARQAFQRITERGVQGPARAQQLGLGIQRTDKDKVEFADLGNVHGQIVREGIGEDAGGCPIQRDHRRDPGLLAFDGNQGEKIHGGTRSMAKGKDHASVPFALLCSGRRESRGPSLAREPDARAPSD